MLKEMEYLGFAMREEAGDVVTFVFDVDDEGTKCYGPYTMSGSLGDFTSDDEAAVITINFKDGTMPIGLIEFDERLRAGESWSNGEYNIFTNAQPIGKAALMSKVTKKKVPLHKVREEEGEEFYVIMLEQCTECLMTVGKAKANLIKKAKKEQRLFKQRLATMEPFFSNEDAFQVYKDLIITMLNEAFSVADEKLVDFILQENEKLEKKGVPKERRSKRIARATEKEYNERIMKDFANIRGRKNETF